MGRAEGRRQKAEGRNSARCPLFCVPCLTAFCLLPTAFFNGCASANKTAADPDPLLGGSGIKPAVQTTSQPIVGPAATAGLPPLPQSNPGLSNAALASGMTRPFDDTQNLRIGDPRGTATDGWAGQGQVTSAAPGGAKLRQPITADLASRQDTGPASTPTTQGTGLLSYEQAQTQLASRGVLWQRLEKVAETGDSKFSCAVPNRQNPRIHRTYEARARDDISAIRAVIAQIDKEQ
jgi:hypothetical protein